MPNILGKLTLIASLLLFILGCSITKTDTEVESITDEWTKVEIPIIQNPDPSMLILPKFALGDIMDRGNWDYYLHPLVIDTQIYNEQPITRGDVIYFKLNGERAEGYELRGLENYAYTFSRVVGLPNERVKIEDGQVYINDAPLDTFYGREHRTGKLIEDSTVMMDEIVIPDGEYFVLHDSWWRSSILTFTIPFGDIEGKVIGYTEE